MLLLALTLASAAPAQPPSPDLPPLDPPAVTLPSPRPFPPAAPLTAQVKPSETARATAPGCLLPDLADCLRGCPTPNDPTPFLRLPKVTTVEECRETDAGGKADARCVWKHVWHTAARFAVPKFDQRGEPLESDALVIYEGMTLTVNSTTGVYDVSFTATAPPTPVTVRLQLLFAADATGQNGVLRLTLPPIRIDPEEGVKSGDNTGRTVRVNHRGVSELFTDKRSASMDLFPKPPRITGEWSIKRVGSARFGSARVSEDQDR